MIDSDAAEADRLEQATPAVEEEDPETGGTPTPSRPLTTLEADEGDALEQSIDVPLDEDYPPDS